MDEKKDPEPTGGEVVSIDEARKRSEEKQQPTAAAGGDAIGNALQPIMAAIARELAGLAGPDGTIKIDGKTDDEATQAKTQALLRGLGQGLEGTAGAGAEQVGQQDRFEVQHQRRPAIFHVTGPAAIQPTPIRSEPPAAPAGAPADGTSRAPPGAEDPTKKNS